MRRLHLEELGDRLHSAQNRLGFALRNFLLGAGPPYQEPAEQKASLFQGQPQLAEHARRLSSQYDLQNLVQNASGLRYLETLPYLEWLDCFFQAEPDAFRQAFKGSDLFWLDVGAKNWSYVEALTAFLQRHGPDTFELHGLEIDPNRRYVDFRTRRQYAEAYLGKLPPAIRKKTHYHQGNILNWRQPVKIISHFMPFVFKEPHLAWGLPLSLFQPQVVLQREISLLAPDGLLLIVNQGEEEAEAQRALLEEAVKTHPLRFHSLGQLPVRFMEYRYPRYGWLCVKRNGS
jgi:hypothetical protein